MGRFAERLRGFAPSSVAPSGQHGAHRTQCEIVPQQGRKALGFPIEVIAGARSAAGYLASPHSLPISKDNRLVIDRRRLDRCILGNGLEPIHTESLYMELRQLRSASFRTERSRQRG
jgi:hypothetical protein